jgi:hypothetical protein
MNVKFSPGPWVVKNGRYIYGNGGFIKPFVASVEDDHNDAETVANARLIASAPELFACLKQVLDSHGELDDALWNRIRNAVADASGDAA